jgi:nucleotide-binding universal stress UspA family protein
MLVTADDSRESLAASTAAARLAVTLDAQIRIFVVVEGDHDGEELERGSGPDVSEHRRQAVNNLLEYLRRKVVNEGVSSTRVEIMQTIGEPFREILEAARAWPADMIVMAASDQRGVRSNYIGSVTEQVIEFASCPVLVIPARSRERSG